MALTETRPPDKKPEHKGPDKREKLPTKVIIRRLPPQMDSVTFLNQISPVPNYDYFYMAKGDMNLGENAFSRAYINFVNPHDVYDFKEKFDNYVFVDGNTGHEYPAVVEFAAFQKIPKKRNKTRVDPKCGTIESDPIYQEFVELIKNPPQAEEKAEYTLQLTTENKNNEVISTPLLEFVKNKRAERLRIREERREERKRKEFERRKYQEDRKKNFEERSPIKYKNQFIAKSTNKENDVEKESDKASAEPTVIEEKPPPPPATTTTAEKFEKSVYFKSREKKFDDRKRDTKPKYPAKKEYHEKREFKNRRDEYKDYRPKYDDHNKKVENDSKTQKKVKKYSEKREERKIEAQKAEQKKLEQQQPIAQQKEVPKETVKSSNNKETTSQDVVKKPETSKSQAETTSEEHREKSKTPEGETQKRIRNKDRPTIAIYRPGMLSKRKQTEEETEIGKKE